MKIISHSERRRRLWTKSEWKWVEFFWNFRIAIHLNNFPENLNSSPYHISLFKIRSSLIRQSAWPWRGADRSPLHKRRIRSFFCEIFRHSRSDFVVCQTAKPQKFLFSFSRLVIGRMCSVFAEERERRRWGVKAKWKRNTRQWCRNAFVKLKWPKNV